MDEAEVFLGIQSKLEDDNTQCAICICTPYNYRTMLYPCFHQFCGLCIYKCLKGNFCCPICRQKITRIYFNVSSPTQYTLINTITFQAREHFFSDQLLRYFHSHLMITYLRRSKGIKKISYLPYSVCDKTICDTTSEQVERNFVYFCFTHHFIPVIQDGAVFCLESIQSNYKALQRLNNFLNFYIGFFSILNSPQQIVEDIIFDLKYSKTFEEFVLDFKLKLLSLSEIFTPIFRYNFTKRLEYEFFAFAISSKDDHNQFIQQTPYIKSENFEESYGTFINTIAARQAQDGSSMDEDFQKSFLSNSIQNSAQVSSKEIHEFRRYIRLALKSENWFKHLIRYIVSKAIPGYHNILSHSQFSYLQPFIQRVVRMRGIVDVQKSLNERELLRLLVHENRSISLI